MTLPTDQKVGGSSPSERATQTGLVGSSGEACCRMGPGASERSSCVYPSSARFEGFWGRIGTQNGPLLPILPKPLNALYFKEADGVYQTSAARDL